ncbi:MAG: ComEC/Rec2 family competence protein [Paracoccaceae bacterium]|nr:ComEC/Rec2 family competence protein [Paracoccaceae bacterium]
MRPVTAVLESTLLGQRGHLFPWAPVCMALGIGGYFALRFEPAELLLWGALGFAVCGMLAAMRLGAVSGPLILALSFAAFGFGLAGLRAHQVAGPLLDFRYYGAIEGRIVGIDRSASDAMRLTLDRVVLERMDPADIPNRVRVSLHGDQGFITPTPGMTVILTGHLSAPNGAVEPGGFDFRRHAWFLRLGAVGYTRTPVLLLDPPGAGQHIFKVRMWISARVQAALPGETGAFAAAVMTGDRSGMLQEMLQDLRDTNLAHLIAISGLHMGLLAGFVFSGLRLGLLFIPHFNLRWPVKKLAAFGALLAAAGYLALSGGNVATERAFVMVAVALVAVMLNRRALSLRSVAMAALIILSLRPEALLSPGFQMSFAATTALVAVFEQMTRIQQLRDWPRWTAPVISLLVSSAVAGAATAPVGMAHFNQSASYGLIANLISVSAMGVIVVPMAVVAALLMPFGLDWMAYAVMALGLDWILGVAHTVADWPGAVRHITAPGPAVLPLMALGALFVALWQGRGRVFGVLPMVVALLLWVQVERPDVLISRNGALVGVMTPEGRALSKSRGAGFVAEVWLENDGSGKDQEGAAALWPGPNAGRLAQAALDGTDVVHVQGKRAAEAFDGCTPGQIVVASTELPGRVECDVFDPDRLRQTGAIAIWLSPEGHRVVTDADRSGRRLWHGAAPQAFRLAAQ